MSKLYRIASIELPGLEVLADDNEHAAQMLIYALMTGLQNQPFCDFEIFEFTERRLKQHKILSKWAHENRKGIAWWIANERRWELVPYDVIKI